MRLYGEIIPPSFSEGIIDRTGAQTILYLTCTTISSVDLAHYGISLAEDWVFGDCGTINNRLVLCRVLFYVISPDDIFLCWLRPIYFRQ